MSVPQQMDVPGYDGRYIVKIDGTVWSRKKDGTYRRMKGTRYGGNILYSLHHQDKRKTVAGGTIMRQTYFAGIPENIVLKRKNGLAYDLAYWNLEPVTRSERSQYAVKQRNFRMVAKVDPETGEDVEYYRTMSEAGRKNYMSPPTIRRYCVEGRIAPDGYRYRLLSEKEL